MRKVFITLMIAVFATGCATQKTVILNYDSTNPVRIEKANQGLDLTTVLPSTDKVDGTIAVRSIEEYAYTNLDVGVVYSIEDNLVANLVANGYRVVERDPDALDNLYREESTKYQKDKSSNDGSDPLIETLDLSYFTPDSSGCCDANSDVFDYLIEDHKSSVNNDGEMVSTSLSASDYILSYRVLECGVNYYAVDHKQRNVSSLEPKLERSARTRLHVRLTDSKTSEIIAAGLVENEVIDIIKKEDVKSLQQMSYEYYHHTLPNQTLGKYRESSGYAKPNKDVKVEKSKETKKKKKGFFSRF